MSMTYYWICRFCYYFAIFVQLDVAMPAFDPVHNKKSSSLLTQCCKSEKPETIFIGFFFVAVYDEWYHQHFSTWRTTTIIREWFMDVDWGNTIWLQTNGGFGKENTVSFVPGIMSHVSQSPQTYSVRVLQTQHLTYHSLLQEPQSQKLNLSDVVKYIENGNGFSSRLLWEIPTPSCVCVCHIPLHWN